jgi:hypothetical protein
VPTTLVLHREDVLQIAVVTLRPDVHAARGIDELRGDAHPGAGLSHAALDHVLGAELAPHLGHVRRLSLERERGIAGDDGNIAEVGERRDDVLGDAVGEIFLLRVAAHVDEGQHGDGWGIRRQWGRGPVIFDNGVIGRFRINSRLGAAYLLVQSLGLGGGLDAQLGLQHVAAGLVLLERERAVAAVGIEPHEGTMGRFLQGVQRQQAPRRGNRALRRALRRARCHLLVEPVSHGLAGTLVQALAFRPQPFLEGGIVHQQAVEKLALIEINRSFEGFGGAFTDRALEGHGVDFDRIGIERHGLAPGDQRRWIGVAQRLAQLAQRLTQAGARLFFAAVAP